MNKNIQKAFISFVFFLGASLLFSQDLELVEGPWVQISDSTGKPESVVYLYLSEGKLFGRTLAIFTPEGVLLETTENPNRRAKILKGEPYFIGLDYIYGLAKKGKEWVGLIMDPRNGEEYDCKIWREGEKLMVRGQLKGLFGGILGRTQVWLPLSPDLLPQNYTLPDASTFNPVIPVKK